MPMLEKHGRGEAFYKEAIAEACPQLMIKQVKLDHSGWDNVVVLINQEIIFRFPSTA
jgi:aminoglycoside 2''-phosphotransferase